MTPELTVLIPSHKRPAVLARTLEHLALQDPRPNFEVVVVIDGDVDHGPARLAAFQAEAPFPLKVLRQSHAGHGAALNRGVNAARGTYCLILGDDIFATPGFTQQHLARLKELSDPRVAVQGLTRWHPELLPDPFLEWESGTGVIFAFPRMQPYSFVSAEYLFTSNVSFTTAWLKGTEGFPEDVPWDMDTLFAFRALDHGLKLFYDPEALAYHYHAWSLETEASRRYAHGLVAARVEENSPEFSDFVTHPRLTPWRRLRYAASRLVRPAAERLGLVGLRGWCWIHELNYRFAQGYRDERMGKGDLHPFHRPE